MVAVATRPEERNLRTEPSYKQQKGQPRQHAPINSPKTKVMKTIDLEQNTIDLFETIARATRPFAINLRCPYCHSDRHIIKASDNMCECYECKTRAMIEHFEMEGETVR